MPQSDVVRFARLWCATAVSIWTIVAMLFPTSVAFAGVVDGEGFIGDPEGFTFDLKHQTIPMNDTHNLTPSSVNWNLGPMAIKETAKAGGAGDIVELTATSEHRVRITGHGNGETQPNPNTIKLTIGKIEAGKVPVVAKVGSVVGRLLVQKHGRGQGNADHFDSVENTFSIKEVGNDAQSMELYTVQIVGKHTENEPKGGGGGMEKETPGASHSINVVTPTVGALAWIADSQTGSFTLGVGLEGITVPEITAARIRVGTRSNPGPIVFDLAPSSFTSFGAAGAHRQIPNAQFPIAQLSQLLGGNTFVEIVTPTATYTGQLSLAINQPVPGESPRSLAVVWIMLLTAGIGALLLRGRTSRRAA